MNKFAAVAAALILSACAAPPPPPPPPVEPPAPATAHVSWFEYAGRDAVFDHQQAGPHDYLNPIGPGYYPDPSILRVGEDYYLVNSTFVHFPGLPIFHSKDMVHWTQIGNAIDRPNQVDFGRLEISRGLYAPQISYQDGTFTIINTCVNCGGNFIITATNPAGPWSDPIWLPFEGIDPSMLFDRDGKVYIVNNDVPANPPQWDGHRAIWMQQYDPVAKKMVGPRKVLVNGGVDIRTHPVWIEGPHLYHIGGWYYLMCAEGGTGLQHSEVILRSRHVWGPYKPAPHNPILTQRDLNPTREFAVTATGHADLVQTQNGQWWAVFLGTRPYGHPNDDFFNTGRETFLLPVTWRHGWPMILPRGRQLPFAVPRPALPYDSSPLQSGNISYRDDFSGTALALQWLTLRTRHDNWYALRNGGLDIQSRPVAIGSFGQPSFLGRRLQNGTANVTIALDYHPRIDGERAGLVALQSDTNFYFLGIVREAGANKLCVSRRQSQSESDNGVALACMAAPESSRLLLRIAIDGGKVGFFYGTAPDNMQPLLQDQDATILSSKRACCFVGTVIGPYAYTP
jgi:xylan 1,4-beta-xylosidase